MALVVITTLTIPDVTAVVGQLTAVWSHWAKFVDQIPGVVNDCVVYQ